jgi:LysR family glycine cleavage system transcriptional activator
VSGQGIALARSTLIVQDLIQKRLTVAFPQTTPIPQSYWLVYPDAIDVTADVIAFRDWLLEAFEADRQFWKLLERAAA